jgi:hypothetical protein
VNFKKYDDETLIGISLTRLLFEPNSKAPTFFSTAELFTKGRYPEVLRHEELISGINGLINFFNQSLSDRELVRHANYKTALCAEAIVYRFGDKSVSLAEIAQAPGLSKNLLDMMRSNSAINKASIHLGIMSRGIRQPQIAMRIGKEILGLLHDWGCNASIVDLQDGKLINEFLNNDTDGQSIVLMPLEGKKGIRPPQSAIEWLQYLDSQKVAFQLCSAASNPLYARHGLATAILAKADGNIFVTEPANCPDFYDSWFIGLDLGRGGSNKGKIVVITLTDPNGILKAYWRARKGKDETLPQNVLHDGLSWVTAEAESIVPGRHLYLLRDGRRPYNESLDF